jgi:hypothetical protein
MVDVRYISLVIVLAKTYKADIAHRPIPLCDISSIVIFCPRVTQSRYRTSTIRRRYTGAVSVKHNTTKQEGEHSS